MRLVPGRYLLTLTEGLFLKTVEKWAFVWFVDPGTVEAPRDQGWFLSATPWVEQLGHPGRALGNGAEKLLKKVRGQEAVTGPRGHSVR